MRILLVFVTVLLFSALDAFGCPGCTYERMLNSHWHEKLFLVKLIAVVVFTYNRLDPVRTFYVFVFYTIGYVTLYNHLIWYSHPAVTEGFPQHLALAGLAFAEFNVLDVALLWGMSRLEFFKKDCAKPLPVWQLATYAFVVFAARWELG